MVEIIPKKTEKKLYFKEAFLYAAGILLLSLILGYVYLIRVEAAALSAKQDLEGEIAKVGNREDREIETKVRNYERKIKDLADLTGASPKLPQFFNNFEKLVHPSVWFSSFNLDVAGKQAVADGHTASFQTLEQQLNFLRSRTDFIELLELSSIGIGEDGGADFAINLTLKPEIFNTIEK